MKRFSAFLLALVMVASIISTCIVFTSAAGNNLLKSYESAADGDLLYEVKFGEKEGVYQSAYFAAGNKNDPDTQVPVISADKRSITIAYEPESSRRIYYGGAIEGLTLGAGKNYTITMNVTYDTANSNAGVYFNYPNSFAEDDLVLRTEYDHIRGHYGTPDVRNTITFGGSKGTGKYISHDKDYVDKTYINRNGIGTLFARNADGSHDIALEVEGNVFRVYINGILFDECDLPDETIAVAGKLGFCIYLYNKGTFTAKNVNVYKGATMKGVAVKPDYVKDPVDNPNTTNKLLKTYDAAKDGDLLYQVNFAATDGVYVPKVLRNSADNPLTDVEFLDNGASIKFTNKGADGAFWYGNIIKGLKMTKDTKYTYEFKAINWIGGKQGGLGFATDPNRLISKLYNFYGRFSSVGDSSFAQVVIERDSSKIPGVFMNTTDYTPIFPKADADGYTNVKVELDGYVFTVYYESMYETGGTYWTAFEQYDMSETFDYTHNSLACIFYIYNANTSLTFKDVKIYKGLLTEKPVTTEAATTTEAPTAATTTTATITTTPAPVTTVATTTAAPKEGGCGGAVVGGLAVIAIVSLAGVVVSKKH